MSDRRPARRSDEPAQERRLIAGEERSPIVDRVSTGPGSHQPSTARSTLGQAAEVSRAGLRSRQERIIAGARPILHSAVAAALAWLLATEVVGHDQPFFAPIAAVITLGLTVGQRRRRAVELAIGVALGIAISDAIVTAIGTGTWQIGLTVALAMVAATLVGGGSLLASQAGASAVLVATLQPPEGGFDFDRSIDSLVGAGTALVVSSLLLPINPLRLVRESALPVLATLVEALGAVATALTSRHPDAPDKALTAVGSVDVAHTHLIETLEAAGEAARLSPQRRRALGGLDRYAVAAGELGLAIENVRGLARGAMRAINLDDDIPLEAVEAVNSLAASVHELGDYLDDGEPEPAREAAAHAAALANAVMDATGNLSALSIVGQIRLAAVDLMRASGLDRGRAQDAVRTARLPDSQLSR